MGSQPSATACSAPLADGQRAPVCNECSARRPPRKRHMTGECLGRSTGKWISPRTQHRESTKGGEGTHHQQAGARVLCVVVQVAGPVKHEDAARGVLHGRAHRQQGRSSSVHRAWRRGQGRAGVQCCVAAHNRRRRGISPVGPGGPCPDAGAREPGRQPQQRSSDSPGLESRVGMGAWHLRGRHHVASLGLQQRHILLLVDSCERVAAAHHGIPGMAQPRTKGGVWQGATMPTKSGLLGRAPT